MDPCIFHDCLMEDKRKNQPTLPEGRVGHGYKEARKPDSVYDDHLSQW